MSPKGQYIQFHAANILKTDVATSKCTFSLNTYITGYKFIRFTVFFALMKRNRLYLMLLLSLSFVFTKGQDAAFTQVFNNRSLLNPSFAGIEQGLRFGLSHRNHWRALAKRNFYNTAFHTEFQSCRFPTMGLGLIATSDVEGEGRLNVNTLGLIYSYKIYFGRVASLSMALQGDYFQGAVDWSRFVFSDQLDPVLGNVRPSSNLLAGVENISYFDFSSGLVFRHNMKLPSKEIFWHLGAAFHHLPFGFNQAFLGESSLPLRFTLHGGWLIPMFKTGHRLNYHVMPYFRWSAQDFSQGKFRSTDLGIQIMNRYLIGSFVYRMNPLNGYVANTDVISFGVGVSSDFKPGTSYRIMYSYDFNYKGVSNGRTGTHEISLLIGLKNICKSGFNRIHKKDCFDYGKKGLESVF